MRRVGVRRVDERFVRGQWLAASGLWLRLARQGREFGELWLHTERVQMWVSKAHGSLYAKRIRHNCHGMYLGSESKLLTCQKGLDSLWTLGPALLGGKNENGNKTEAPSGRIPRLNSGTLRVCSSGYPTRKTVRPAIMQEASRHSPIRS